MGNYKWNSEKVNKDARMVVVLFISRNKDNKNIPNFKVRKESMFCHADANFIAKHFDDFIANGVKGETCRCYISCNARDPKKVKTQLLHYLIDKEDINYTYLNAVVAGIAAKKECALEKHWFFDFDSADMLKLGEFVKDIHIIDPGVQTLTYQTPHGHAVVCERGFDTRELMKKWGDIATLKRDDLICVDWEIID